MRIIPTLSGRRTLSALGCCLCAGGVLGLAGCSTTPAAPSTNIALLEATEDAKLVLVAMHADWCATCQRLEPEVESAMGNLSNRGVYLVKADLTDRRFPEGKTVLEGMGLGRLFSENKGRTGLVYILDGETGEILGKIEGRATREEIFTRVNRALDRKLADA